MIKIRDYPEASRTFMLPPDARRKSVTVGMYVKLVFEDDDSRGERMWVRVTERYPDGKYAGVLDNRPVAVRMEHGDRVEFSWVNIIDITRA